MQINQTNHESYFLSYVDGELSDAERDQVDEYCLANPDAARELIQLQQTVSDPPATFFMDKSSLYRQEDERRVVAWYFWRAAAIVVLITGSLVVYLITHRKTKEVAEQDKMALLNNQAKIPAVSIDSSADLAQLKSDKSLPVVKVDDAGLTGSKVRKIHVNRGKSENVSPADLVANLTATHNRNHSGLEPGGRPAEDKSETEFTAAGAKQLEVNTVRSSSTVSGNLIKLSESEMISGSARLDAGKVTGRDLLPRDPVAINDLAAPSDRVGSAGDDAVSVVHLGNSGRSVRKLLRRITSGKDQGPAAETSSDKKVNISIFQFALGK